MKQLRLYKICKNKLAFSLIELVVVVSLIAILAATVVPVVRSNQDSVSAEQWTVYWETFEEQVKHMGDVFNNAKTEGDTARIGGYSLETARGWQACLRAFNNNDNLYEIEVTTSSTTPRVAYYKYIDTFVVCVNYYNGTTLIKNSNGACSPEKAENGVLATKCKIIKIWWIKTTDVSSPYRTKTMNY